MSHKFGSLVEKPGVRGRSDRPKVGVDADFSLFEPEVVPIVESYSQYSEMDNSCAFQGVFFEIC